MNPITGIRNAIHEGKIYSVTNTCPLDTGLFVLYHAYKAGTEKFRGLFERDDLDAFITIRRTFQLVESDGWVTVRLYWLILHGLLRDNSQNYVHDIKNTLTEIAFKGLSNQCRSTLQDQSVRVLLAQSKYVMKQMSILP